MILQIINKDQVMLALEDNMSAKFAFLPKLINETCIIDNNLLVINTHYKTDMLNIICRSKTSNISAITTAINEFRNEELPFAYWTGFYNEPLDLNKQLEKLGLVCTENELGMAIELSELPDKNICPELNINSVENITQLNDFISVMSELMPTEADEIKKFYIKASDHILQNPVKLKLFVGYINNKPVATSALFCEAGVVGIWDIITLPIARRKGIGTDMTLAALKEGKKRGYHIGVLTASDEGKFVYQKLGFNPLQQFHV